MDLPKKGSSNTRPSMPQANNFLVLESSHENFLKIYWWACLVIYNRWLHSPVIVIEGISTAKHVASWTKTKLDRAEWNNKALNALYNGAPPDEFIQSSTCDTAKELCDILGVTHEGTEKVKLSKLQRLMTDFELIVMQ